MLEPHKYGTEMAELWIDFVNEESDPCEELIEDVERGAIDLEYRRQVRGAFLSRMNDRFNEIWSVVETQVADNKAHG